MYSYIHNLITLIASAWIEFREKFPEKYEHAREALAYVKNINEDSKKKKKERKPTFERNEINRLVIKIESWCRYLQDHKGTVFNVGVSDKDQKELFTETFTKVTTLSDMEAMEKKYMSLIEQLEKTDSMAHYKLGMIIL